MNFLRFTLVGEGTSDENLVPILEWAVREKGIEVVRGRFARWDLLPQKPTTLAGKIVAGLNLFQCDLIFIHRDADNSDPIHRRREIENAVIEAKTCCTFKMPSVPVIPVRETEAWLLIEEKAIRMAANNPNGKNNLMLPPLKNLEKCSDPKKELLRVLRTASEQSPQRLKRFDTRAARARVVSHISDFRPLRSLSAFQELELDLAALQATGWK